jgi:hypothetical protein
METEGEVPRPASSRPRPILLVLLAIVLAGLLWTRFGGSAAPGPAVPPPAQARANAPPGTGGPIDPARLDVQLESLESERPAPGQLERNPFRFRPEAEPPSRPSDRASDEPVPEDALPPAPTGPPPPPPITVKFLGTMELPNGMTHGLFTDCTGNSRRTIQAPEGSVILGQYRLVKIGLESAVIEHLDGRGRTTLAKNGQECVWKQ